MTPDEIGHLVAERRRALRLTQTDLAARAGVGRRTLIELESGSGTTDIGFRKFERILNAVGLTLSVTEAHRRPTEDELRKVFDDEDSDVD
ncbi:hypothetical protein CAL12_25425 [Bordetella genomosp. 8]|uniref:HTH cro/C1-type domain-containing protein n=1 Tax=Bordetella genomosp. 8 TaxID=1416806 RepID=A0A1W6YRV9_9BORD|nr:helix-turn-helix domain-containing protein [Bordetella genomosp. 8]ARP83822.1 hypothetical protein CAL12_25425 [Bordetella genomosp. 8]